MKKTVVVLCGSMKVKDEIIKIKDELEKKNYKVLLPIECIKRLTKKITSKKKNIYRFNSKRNKKRNKKLHWT